MIGLAKIKACRRCGGDLFIEKDSFGVYLECLQCGASWNQPDLSFGAPAKKYRYPTKVKATHY